MELNYLHPSLTKLVWMYTERTLINVMWFGSMPIYSICLNNWRTSLPYPCSAYPVIIEFHETESLLGMSWNRWYASSMFPHFSCMVIRELPTKNRTKIHLWWCGFESGYPVSELPSWCLHPEHKQRWYNLDWFHPNSFDQTTLKPLHHTHFSASCKKYIAYFILPRCIRHIL